MTVPESYLPEIEAELEHTVTLQTGQPPLLLGMIRYHMGWVDAHFQPAPSDGGKRVRPTLLLLASESVGGDWRQALPAAAGVELLHNFTLIHDDIEDRDTLRRGRPTLWSIWGIPQAINAGDALFAISYRALLGLAERDVEPGIVVTAAQRYTEAVVAITEGQCMDLAFEELPRVDEGTYLRMVEGKTARLLGLAAELGGIIAGAPEAATRALRRYGEALGMTFQMLDDILGLWGNPQETGKPVGADLQKRKKTLPILHGMARSAALCEVLAQPELGTADLHAALDELERTGSRTHTETRAAEYHRVALEALAQSGASGAARDALAGLATRLLTRQR